MATAFCGIVGFILHHAADYITNDKYILVFANLTLYLYSSKIISDDISEIIKFIKTYMFIKTPVQYSLP